MIWNGPPMLSFTSVWEPSPTVAFVSFFTLSFQFISGTVTKKHIWWAGVYFIFLILKITSCLGMFVPIYLTTIPLLIYSSTCLVFFFFFKILLFRILLSLINLYHTPFFGQIRYLYRIKRIYVCVPCQLVYIKYIHPQIHIHTYITYNSLKNKNIIYT